MKTKIVAAMGQVKSQSAKLATRYAWAVGTAAALSIFVGAATGTQAQGAGGKIFYSTGSDIFVVNADGSNSTQLTDISGKEVGNNFWPSATRNGSKVIFNSNVSAIHKIKTMNADGSGLKRLSNGTVSEEEPSISPDGSKIVFTSSIRDGSISIMNADGSGKKSLGAKGRNPVFSPDGHKIAYVNRPLSSNVASIYTMNVDGSNQNLVIEKIGLSGPISFSPDGRRIAFSTPFTAGGGIYLVNVDGSNPIRVNNSPNDVRGVSFSPDGRRLAFNSRDPINSYYAIYSMNLDGSDKQKIALSYNPTPLSWTIGSAPPRTISVENEGASEGDNGQTRVEFIVRLSSPATEPVTVTYNTFDGTATGTGGSIDASTTDFIASSGTLAFYPGGVNQTIYVDIVGDTRVEATETFGIQLSGAQGAGLLKAEARGTIVNDDPSVRSPGKIVFDSARYPNSGIYIHECRRFQPDSVDPQWRSR